MDLGIVSPSKDNAANGTGTVHTRTGSRNRSGKAPHDRSSLCSQSSQSSSASSSTTSSSTSSSEYSVPKNCLEAFYDRPKNVHFPYNRLSLTEDKDAPHRLGPIKEGPCTCWKQQKTSDNTISHELLLFGGGLLCSCWGGARSGGGPGGGPAPDVDMPSVSSSGSSNASPSTSPKKQMPLVSVPILLPCTCGRANNPTNPYLNYAVPRSGAPVKCVKEEVAEKASTPSTGETAESQETKIINRMDNANIPTDDKEDNGNVVRQQCNQPKTAQPIPVMHHNQQVCPCQRLLLCPGSLMPTWGGRGGQPESARRLGGRNSSEYGSVNPKLPPPSGTADNENVKRRADHNLNCKCRQPPVACPQQPPCCCGRIAFGMPFLNTTGRTGRKDNANHIYVNLKYLQETAAAAMGSHGVPGKLIPYYANLHFLQTLSLYENADILDVRPSLMYPDATIPEGQATDGQGTAEDHSKKPIGKKRLDPPSNNGVYEMMSFNQSEFPSAPGDNYLLMQPGTLEREGELVAASADPPPTIAATGAVLASTSGCGPPTATAPPGDVAVSEEESAAAAAGRESSILPLRPFMPVLLPFHEHTCELKDDAECSSCKSNLERKCCEEACYRSSRSSSLGDIKVSTFRRGRSSSTDGRTADGEPPSDGDGCLNSHQVFCASPKSTPVRKHPLLTKLTLRSKEKSFSTDEITPPSSAPSSPDSMFLESIHKYPFHRSADCLQLNEEYRLSEEDLSQDPEVIMSQSMEKSRISVSTIKRSSSVPCKTNPNLQPHHGSVGSADPGVLPPAAGAQGAVFSHFIAYHGSLPRRHTGNAASRHPVPEKKVQQSKVQQPQQEQKQATDPSKMIFISAECKQCHQFVTSPEGLLVLDAKSMTSSSSSDMSDYIESLSLCSRSSSGSGSSGCGTVSGISEYARTEDLCNALMKIPTSCTSSLRPRSGKEYHSFDRVLIQDGCPYVPVADCSHLNLSCLKPFMNEEGQQDQTCQGNLNNVSMTNNINNNNFNNKTNSPSPGYVSSSPGTTDFPTSPEKTTHFAFPKDGKELNYLEVVSVGDSEPTSPVVKQANSTVQYAVIDMVATAAARKLSTERAQLRNEGRSPTPTDCSPKHSISEEQTTEDKK